MIFQELTEEHLAAMPVADRKRYQNRRWQHRVWPKRQEYLKAYYQKNKDKIKSKSHDRYHANPAEIIKQQKEYVSRNRARVSATHRKYSSENRERLTEYHRYWRSKNRGVWAQMSSARRAAVRNVSINLVGISSWMQKMRSKDFVTCYYCQNLFHACEIHFDHVIPISRGGPHEIGNLCVSCPRCNLSKGCKTIGQWDNKPELILDL